MSYKHLRSKLNHQNTDKLENVFNAFEAEGRTIQQQYKPVINNPVSDYNNEIENIKSIDSKLGITFERLNQHQRHAVFFQSKNTILSAMVGSGKTTVLIAKIFYLHFIKQVPFHKIIVLTFTNKAAREIKERITLYLGDKSTQINQQLRYFGTFHSVARQILNEHPKLIDLGFKPGFQVMDEQEKQAFLERLIIQKNLTIKYINQLNKRWKNYKATNQIIMGNMKSEDDFGVLVELAEKEKRVINSMDFDDLIDLCNKLTKQKYFNIPDWIIIDEFQDCNEDQLTLIENIKNIDTGLFVVGDQNQSIYGWRGSKENLFQEVQFKWNAIWMELPQNYRSTENILSAADSLLYENNGSLIATRQSGQPIDLVRHFDDQQEAFYLKEKLQTLQKENVLLDNIAILSRTHQQISILETTFKQAGIPYQLGKKDDLHDNPALSYFLKVLKVCVNPNDDDACLALIFDNTFGAIKRNKNIIQALNNREQNATALNIIYQKITKQKKPSKNHIALLQQIIKFNTEFINSSNIDANNLTNFLNLKNILKPTSIHHNDYMININQAWEQLLVFMNSYSWLDFLSALKLAVGQVVLESSFYINGRIKEKRNGVHILTIHASKGLEFDRVFIAGANTGIIPLSQHQKGSQNLKEEKRLLFVAITRGKNHVEIGWYTQPSMRNTEAEPSYFLNVIPDSLLNRKTAGNHTSKPSITHTSEDWQIEMPVKHNKYGAGIISEITDTELICIFESVGKKSFSKAFAIALLSIIK